MTRSDPNAERTTKVCDTILTLTAKSAPSRLESALRIVLPVVFASGAYFLVSRRK